MVHILLLFCRVRYFPSCGIKCYFDLVYFDRPDSPRGKGASELDIICENKAGLIKDLAPAV